ncbi:hypothetical protein CFOL_v3_28946 [Cephalotus follicularis]|uniref:C2H2-type domain-containing protein n=1 Tax=Cephalotus follicularis TaxID=3775 RepID=A0A1Q3CZ53_CEPFO|nr:hypothetical protein CFOL_v3_28946 [Cephalotus follicularis]
MHKKMKPAVLLFACFAISLQFATVSSSTSFQFLQDYKESATGRTLKQMPEDAPEVHCSRERSRAAWKIIEGYLMPFVEKERYQISRKCRLHPDNDLYRDQEQHKIHVHENEWRCGYCKKVFYEEKYLDQHFDNRHYNLLNVSSSRCLADICGALHCDHVLDSTPRKSKCNPAAAARNKHLCESLAGNCFPVNEGPSASRLHEFFLRQFCDAHTCIGNQKPFSGVQTKQRSIFYVVISIVTLMVLPLYYTFVYMYQRGIRRGTQELKRITKIVGKKKPH